MKLTKENYEMLMFDLLEGNLSKEEEYTIMQEIEQNPFFSEEWRLFSETMLEPETVVFTKKESLLKEEKAVIIPLRSRWQIFSYAAAVAAIFFGVFYFSQSDKNGQEIAGSMKESSAGSIAGEIPQDSPINKESENKNNNANQKQKIDYSIVPPTAGAVVVEKKRKKSNSKAIIKDESKQDHQKTKELDLNSIVSQDYEKNMGTDLNLVNDKNHDSNPLKSNNSTNELREVLVDLNPKITPSLLQDSNGNNTFENQNNNDIDILKSDKELDGLQPVIAYTGLRSFTRRTFQRLITPFKNPKIKFARVEAEEKPALNISFSSNAYFASAIVHLR